MTASVIPNYTRLAMCGKRAKSMLWLDTASYQLAAGLGEWRPSRTPPMRLEHFLRKAAELLLSGVAVSDLRLLEKADYGYLSSLRRAAEEAGLSWQLNYAGLRADHLQDTVRAADALGCQVVTFQPALDRPADPESLQARLQHISDLISRALPLAERYFVRLAVGGRGLTAAELLHLYEEADSELVGFCLDPASAFAALEDTQEWAETLGSNLLCLRLSDYQMAPASYGAQLFSCPLGEGIVDIPALLETVGRVAPEAAVLLATPEESLPLPFLEENYLERLPGLRPAQVARVARLLRDRGLPSPPALSATANLSEDEILAREDDRFQQSLEWLRSRLGEERPAAE